MAGRGVFCIWALAALDPDGVVQMIEGEGVATKVEATGKVFPASDRAADVSMNCWAIAADGAELAFGEPLAEMNSGRRAFARRLRGGNCTPGR